MNGPPLAWSNHGRRSRDGAGGAAAGPARSASSPTRPNADSTQPSPRDSRACGARLSLGSNCLELRTGLGGPTSLGRAGPAAAPSASLFIWASAAGDGVDILDARRQPALAPRPSTVLGAEDLAGPAHAVNLTRILMMQRDGHHRALGFDAAIEPRPRLPEVLAAVERAILTARGGAEACVEHARILRRYPHIPRIGERREAPDFHVPPDRAAIAAAEESHSDGEEDGARRRRAETHGMAVQHALGIGIALDPALEMRPLGQRDQGGTHVLPRLAAVEAAEHAADLERGVELLRMCRIGGKPHHAAGEAHLDAVRSPRSEEHTSELQSLAYLVC